MEICDKAGKNTDEAKNYLKIILKRLSHADPHIAIQAVTVWYYYLYTLVISKHDIFLR